MFTGKHFIDNATTSAYPAVVPVIVTPGRE